MVGPPVDEYDGYRECSLCKLIQSDYAQNKKTPIEQHVGWVQLW